jgi:SAM-dependent methyltransferase
MDGFADEAFDAVFFLWNAIDDADPGDRILILNEVHRVLKRSGVFVFSAHNLGASAIPAFDFPGVALSWNPITLIKENALPLKVYSSGLFKRILARHEMQARGYAVLHEYESTARCVVPTYYITRRTQIGQLEDAGFHQVEAVDKNGSFISRDSCSEEYWYIYYVARKK